MKDVTRTTEPPDGGLGLIAGHLVESFEMITDGLPNTVRLIVMLDEIVDEGQGRHHSLIALSGYDTDMDATTALFKHMAAIFEANGRKLLVMPLGMG